MFEYTETTTTTTSVPAGKIKSSTARALLDQIEATNARISALEAWVEEHKLKSRRHSLYFLAVVLYCIVDVTKSLWLP